MILKLKCKCTGGETDLAVRDREDGEDILDYMDHIMAEIGKWHKNRGCSADKLEYMKMPISKDKPIGVSK